MEFSLKKPISTKTSTANDTTFHQPRVIIANFNNKDENGTSAKAYLKTAEKAKEAGNHKREAELIEKAISTMGVATPSVMRRYASALYKCGEYRAAGAVLENPICRGDDGDAYVDRLKAQLDGKYSIPFIDILNFTQST